MRFLPVLYTPKPRVRFSIRIIYINSTFVLISPKPREQPDVSTCTSNLFWPPLGCYYNHNQSGSSSRCANWMKQRLNPIKGPRGNLRPQSRSPKEDQEIQKGQEEVEAVGRLQRQLGRLRGGGRARREGDLQTQKEEEKVSMIRVLFKLTQLPFWVMHSCFTRGHL